MRRIWRSVVHNYREGGLFRVLAKMIMRLRRFVHANDEWLIYSAGLADFTEEPAVQLSENIAEFAGLQERKYFKAREFPEVVRRRLDRGQRCHTFEIDGRFAAVAWVTEGRLVLEDDRLEIPLPGALGIYDCVTLAEFRGRGVYPSALRRLLARAGRQEFERAYIAVDPSNRASIRGIEKAGFQPAYRLQRSIRLGRVTMSADALQLVRDGRFETGLSPWTGLAPGEREARTT